MTLMVFDCLILIRIDCYDFIPPFLFSFRFTFRFSFRYFSFRLLLIERIYQTHKTVSLV